MVPTVRRPDFAFPEDLDPAWNHRLPEFAFAANSVSLIMPYAEPYFVRSVRRVLPDLEGDLAAEAKAYVHQEAEHHGQHRRFNDVVGAAYPGVRRIERWMGATYGWLDRTRSARFNMAFAAGSEAIAFALARWTERHLGELFDDAEPAAASLFLWHLAEEVEHKSVAFDVYAEVDGSKLRYTAAMVLSLTILAWFTFLSTMTMLVSSRRALHPVAYYRLLKWAVGMSWTLLPDLAVSALPSHHPTDLADPIYLGTWLGAFDPHHPEDASTPSGSAASAALLHPTPTAA